MNDQDEPGVVGRGSGNGTIKELNAGIRGFFERRNMPNHNWRARKLLARRAEATRREEEEAKLVCVGN